ncbi:MULTISPECIES: 1,4-dihydroxy-2-naphthoate polyprenyltransferase [unclassified Streptococcus]|uniref:1,4-dihydroxy-2-naphthoate polyprenyltransferase n=1 Tax=unclassified Streptococcus TaxID=2608887 RepID=UPI001071EBC7|nr:MULTISPECIES: 1,4-dihydroxy-2-naphthoate polyprenyltransferase [unclassified Streptococcus]MBF0787592.1 1,4-dihydroxy-2-naphthoate polyprenyltransferase [Streptococcus sp. 19428wC2_LYSM12]MCQ9211979.1 1,4-dihydroxy-2-naphthoate polyprenyltransferase [Streptococcus sp. B01]MCQ9213308.1 1,4-dihydroxy-2-naphthoate polyprenyltransferase [Streptococcus sp. O1]TFV05461.1 1,4-dihydroxy-2-naphthoate polyprenyltransferase [Streptococcus sp. LYSM12]
MTNEKGRITLPIFLEFIELRTKVASVFPMLLGIVWAIYRYGVFNGFNTLLFVLAVLTFDMCTTAINNTMDYVKAKDQVYRKEHNVIGRNQLDFGQMVQIIFLLLSFSTVLSLVLVWRTDLILLPLGALCFLIGICYTFGPIPLSRMPLGEIFSGVTMGLGIFFLGVFVQAPDLLLVSRFVGEWFQLQLAWEKCIEIGLMSLPLICLIANIMLANNLCDLDEDIRNHRHTLVFHIGRQKGLLLYTCLAILPWFLWLLYPLFGFLPFWAWLGYGVAVLSYRSLGHFLEKQVKRETFVEAVKSFILFSLMYLLVLIVACLV